MKDSRGRLTNQLLHYSIVGFMIIVAGWTVVGHTILHQHHEGQTEHDHSHHNHQH